MGSKMAVQAPQLWELLGMLIEVDGHAQRRRAQYSQQDNVAEPQSKRQKVTMEDVCEGDSDTSTDDIIDEQKQSKSERHCSLW